jgi:MbtH protein
MENLTVYNVVVNHEEQYSIWPVERALPLGWTRAGKTGSKAECLAFISQVWSDMTPSSLRQEKEERKNQEASYRAVSGVA